MDEATREWIESVRSGEVEVQVCSLESGPSNLEYYVYEHEVLTPMLSVFGSLKRKAITLRSLVVL